MPVLMTSELKKHAGEILDAARRQPQYIFRAGRLFMLAPIEPNAGFNPPEGYFSDAYPLADERQNLEKASLKIPQSLKSCPPPV
jgi:hypothetical protein